MPWLARDLRLALRVLRKEVAFTALAVLTLGLGIGAATTIFSVIDAVLFNPYPYAHIERNVALEVRDLSRAGAGGRAFFKLPELLDYKEQVQSFEDVIAGGFTDVLYTTAQGTEQFTGGLMSGNNFEFLGIPAARGRTLLPEDARPGAPPVYVMRHTTWATRFGSDPGLLGRTLVLNGVPTTVVGIMPPRFHKVAADFYLPVSLDRADPVQRDRFFRLQARLKPGVTLAEAEAEVKLVAQRVALSLVLLAGAALLMRSFVNQTQDLGFEPDRVEMRRVDGRWLWEDSTPAGIAALTSVARSIRSSPRPGRSFPKSVRIVSG